MSRSRLVSVLIAGSALLAAPAFAAQVDGIYSPLVTAGDPAGTPPDTPADRVDPNVPTSPYSGVVSINIRYDGKSFICSGALISKRHVLSAGHCVDTTGNGDVIDVSEPFAVSGRDVRVVYNATSIVGDPGRAVVTATKVTMHPDYDGFGNCPPGVAGFCLNDDLAIIELPEDAPDSAQVYRVQYGAVPAGSIFNMVGYGTSGDGVSGYYVSPNFRIKRSGFNVYDLADLDDEKNFVAGGAEVWYADFDGLGIDTFCLLGLVCGDTLGNDIEAGIGGGDSGGPSFIWVDGELRLVANNTFGGRFAGQVPGTFGTYFGGILLSSYYDWLRDNGGVIPEPGALGLGLFGLAGLAFARRRKRVV
jgi:hypothetical protein